MTEQLANNAQTTLNGTITAGALTLVITSASAFPGSGTFRIRIDSEIMTVTAVAGTTLTVTRGAESTSAAAHTTGATVTAILTAAAITQIKSDAFTAGGDLSGTATSQTVAKINATTITTAGGALAVGAVLRTTAVGTADWGTVNLADTDAVTGTLPEGNGGTGIAALGSGVGAMLGTFSSANIKTACTDETGSGGALVFATSPTLTTPVINGQIQGAAVAIAAMAIDWALGPVFTKSLAAGANTFTFSNQASGMCIVVRVTSNGLGSTLSWPTVLWPGGAAPTQTNTGVDVYTFVHDGTSIYGSAVQAMA